jgi:hypothetical protein
MQLDNIPEFAGTQDDSIQPSDFIKMIKHQFLSSGTTADDQKVGLFELYLKSDSPAEEWYSDAATKKRTRKAIQSQVSKRKKSNKNST